MAFDAINLQMIEIPCESRADGETWQGNIYGSKRLQRPFIMERAELDYARTVSQLKDFVVRLPIVGGKKDACEGHLYLKTEQQRKPLDMEAVEGKPGETEVEVGFGRAGIVGALHIIDAAYECMESAAREQRQGRCRAEVVMVAQRIVDKPCVFAKRSGGV